MTTKKKKEQNTIPCKECEGTGKSGNTYCPECEGSGSVKRKPKQPAR